MKNTVLLRAVISAFVVLFFLRAYSAEADTDNRRDPMEEKIWALEEAYFTNLYKANYDEVLAIVHGQFLGWPSAAPQPVNKEESARFMKQSFPKPVSCALKIERNGIRLLGEIALTQYILNVKFNESAGAVKTLSSRITHTWVKEGASWKLLGGMSCDK